MTQLPPGLRDRVLASRKAEPAPRGSWPRRLGLWALFSAGWCGVGLWSTGLRGDWSSLPGWYRLASLLALGGSAGALSVLGMMRGRSMLGASVAEQRAALVALPLFLLGWVVLVGSLPPSGADGSWANMPWCHVFSLVGAAPLLGLLVWFKRGLTVPTPALTGATLGAAAAAWAHVVVFSHCPFNDSLHTSLGHAAPMIPMMLAGALAGYRFFR